MRQVGLNLGIAVRPDAELRLAGAAGGGAQTLSRRRLSQQAAQRYAAHIERCTSRSQTVICLDPFRLPRSLF